MNSLLVVRKIQQQPVNHRMETRTTTVNSTQRAALIVAAIVVFLIGAVQSAQAQQFELISSFAGCPLTGCGPADDPANPGPLVLGPDGNFYGTSPIDWRLDEDAPRDWGTVYRITPDGSRVILHRFAGNPGGCEPRSVTFGADGALYGTASKCDYNGTLIFRIGADGFSIVQEFTPGELSPETLVAANGAFYGLKHTPTQGTVLKWDGQVTVLGTFLSTSAFSNLILAPDGKIYFPTRWDNGIIDIHFGSILRITADNRIETVHDFSNGTAPLSELVLGLDGALYGSATEAFAANKLYRVTPSGTLTYPSGFTGGVPLGAGFDRSVYLAVPDGDHGGIARLTAGGSLLPVHTFSGADGSGDASRLTKGRDGHLYGTTRLGGEHGLGVFFRLRMPSVDVKANGADGPIGVTAGGPLQISMAFDASATEIVDPSEVYFAVVTPAQQILWATPSGFSLTAVPLYSGPLPSFASTPLIDIPDAAALPPGDYYWVAIVDADANGAPNGHYVDFVKTTRIK